MNSAVSTDLSPIAMWSPALGELEARGDYRLALASVVALATVGGAVLRLWNLGALGMVVDEGFMALAVDGILKHGLPVLDHGYAYTRSLPFQYMQAACAWLLGNDALALRLPAAVFGIACIPVGYALGRLTLGRTVGAVLAVILAFSIWEIELSRYGRFYTLLQLIWMLAVIAFYRGFIDDRRWPKAAFFALAALGYWVHPLMIFIGTLFLMVLPRPGYTRRRKLAYLGLMATFALLRVLADMAFERLRQAILDAGIVPPSGAYASAHRVAHATVTEQAIAPIYLPGFEDVVSVAQSHPIWLALLAAMGAAAIGLIMAAAARGEDKRQCLVAAAAVACAVGDQLGVTLVLAILFATWWVRQWSDLRRSHVLVSIAAVAACGGGWFGINRAVQGLPPRMAISHLLEFPNYHGLFLKWMLLGWPAMTLGLAAGLVAIAARAGRGDRVNPAWFALMSLLLPLTLACVLKSRWLEARYFFHMYPQVALVFAVVPVLAAAWLARLVRLRGPVPVAAVAAVTLAATLWFSQDANPLKSARIPQRSYTDWRDPIKTYISWWVKSDYHQDHAGAAAFVRQRLQPDDVVVVIGPPHNAALYRHLIGRVDYVFGHVDYYPRMMEDAAGHPIDDMSDAIVLDTLAELRRVVEMPRDGRVWIVSDTILSNPDHWLLERYDGPDRTWLRDLTADPAYTARDRRQTVTRVGDDVIANRD